MQKTPLLVIAAFLAGALTGALAVAGYSHTDATPETAAPPDAAMAVREAGPSPALGAEAESASQAAEPDQAEVSASPADAEFQSRLEDISRGWTRLEAEIARLQARIDGLERRLVAAPAAGGERAETAPADPAEQRRTALVKAGLAEDQAAALVWREAQADLDRLELRDLAMREGWFGTDRYREELGRIETEVPRLRAEVGDEVYDRYLYAVGEQNRVRISSVIPGSAAEDAGLRAGDMIETYEGARVFGFNELRRATSGGERDELVPVQIRRADGTRVQAWLPRGPLGVRLDMARADPDA
ncbi:MAG: PDZ domain-containing protein [Chromatiaceae bacterium]|jgi:hypothetical protein|nr:PDZ domain-containing protein [Chromatiaceae bacterium]